MARRRERLGFTIGILVGVLSNLVVSSFVEAVKAFPAKHQEHFPAWSWAVLFIVFSIAFFYLSRIALKEIFDARSLCRLNIGAVAFVIAGIVLIVTDILGG